MGDVTAAISQGKLKGLTGQRQGSVTITDSPDNMVTFFESAQGAEAFGYLGKFERVRNR